MLAAAKERDPVLKRLLEQQPGMAGLLQPERLRALAALAADPERMRAEAGSLFGGMDLAEQRKVRCVWAGWWGLVWGFAKPDWLEA